MRTPALALQLSTPDGGLAKKKRVLLLDTSETRRGMWAVRETHRLSRWAEAIEQHSLREALRAQRLFATETETTTATETALEREELL